MQENRRAKLILVSPTGALLGCLPPILVATPWWNDAEAIVDAARAHYGIAITVLRLLGGETDARGISRVTYLAETADRSEAVQPWHGTLDEQPLRHPYARPGGPAADLAWAKACLEAHGYRQTGAPVQVRTWNLSSLCRIPVTSETLWLKVVPPFFAHEGTLLAALSGAPVPKLIAHDGGRMLLAEIAGQDFYNDATHEQFQAMIALLVEIQVQSIGREQDFLALGLPDWRLSTLATAMADVLERTQTELSAEDTSTLAEFLNHLPGIACDIEACGLPYTVVHGDFHPGNLRGTGFDLTLLDWGDSGVSHPLLDQTALLRHVPEAEADRLRTHWHGLWRKAVRGSNPDRAAQLLKPLAAVHQAIIRQRFIDNIEPAEHFYHLPKRAVWLRRAAELYRALNY